MRCCVRCVSVGFAGMVPRFRRGDTNMGELRKQMDGDLVVRGMAVRTREAYLGAVVGLAKYYGRRPDRLSEAQVQSYLLHLIQERKLAWSSCNIVAQGLKFFYRITLKRTQAQFGIPTARQPQKLPQILARGGSGAPGEDGEPQAPSDPDDDLRGGAEAERALPSEAHRHRLGAHDDPGRAGQGRKRPLHAALAAAARGAAPLLDRVPAQAVAIYDSGRRTSGERCDGAEGLLRR